MHADTDIIFQADIFDTLHAFVRSDHELHMISESPAERNDGYTARRLRGYPLCNAALKRNLANATILPVAALETFTAHQPLQGRSLRSKGGAGKAAVKVDPEPESVLRFWSDFGATHRLNFGSMFGTTEAMASLCEQVVDALVGPMSTCWDQGILNVLVWTGLAGASGSATAAAIDLPWLAGTSPITSNLGASYVSPAFSTTMAVPRTIVGGTNAPMSIKGARRRRQQNVHQQSRAPRIVVWDCFDGPVRTLDVGSLRDGAGRFYSELGELHPIVHQFRPTRQSAFVASLRRVFPPRPADASERLNSDVTYHTHAWQAELFDKPLQRVPFVWDDKRRMEKIDQQMRASGLGNPADAKRPLPTLPSPCLPPSLRFRACAHRDEVGSVHGAAWEAMAADGYVLGAATPLRLSEPRERT